jgi:hypothetical protein
MLGSQNIVRKLQSKGAVSGGNTNAWEWRQISKDPGTVQVEKLEKLLTIHTRPNAMHGRNRR